MADILKSMPGTVVVIAGDNPGGITPAIIRVPDLLDGNRSAKILLQKFSYSAGVNFEAMQTLGDSVYIYHFGNKLGMLRLSGLIFISDCNDSSTAGLNKIFEFWKNNKLNKSLSPVEVTIAGLDSAFNAYLVAMTVDTASTENNLLSFTFDLIVAIED